MPRSAASLFFSLFLLTSPLFAHGGQFRPPGGNPRTPTPPGLPAQPTAPSQTGKVRHSWTTWWGYSQFQYLDYRKLQRERRGPITGSGEKKDVDAWRDELRTRLIPVLRKAILDKDKEVRTAAAVALGKLEAKEAIDDLMKVLVRDKRQEVREAALIGLMYMREPQLRPTFEKYARKNSEKLRIRGFALFGIGRLGDAASVKYLQAFFDPKNKRARAILPSGKGERREFRVACLAALLMGEETNGLDDFFLAVSRNTRYDEHVRAYAVNGLGKINARSKLPDLVRFLRNPKEHVQVQRSAAVAIGVVGKPADANARKALVNGYRTGRDSALKHFCLIAVGKIGGGEGVKALLKHEKTARSEDREFTLIALGLTKDPRAGPPLVKALHNESNARRKSAAAIALGLMGDRKLAGDVLKEYNRAKDWLLLQSCSLSIGMLGYQPAAKRLKEVLTTKRQPALRSAAALAYALIRQQAAVPLFVDMLKSSNSIVTLTAIVRVMSYLSSPVAAKPLEELFANKKVQQQVRAYALVSLGQLADRSDFPFLMTLGFDINYFVRCPPLDEALTIL